MSSTTTFTMPAETVTVTATYKALPPTPPEESNNGIGGDEPENAPVSSISTPTAKLEDMLLMEDKI